MKQMRKYETLTALTIAVLIADLILAPFICDLSQAQAINLNSPVISHQPKMISYRGKPLNILAHVGTQSRLSKVALKITHDGKTVTGVMPAKKDAGVVPVLVTASGSPQVLSGPGAQYSKKTSLQDGETLYVTQINGDFYRIRTESGLNGYVESRSTELVLSGSVYGVAIPASMTAGSEISYQIIATDIKGNVASTDIVNVALKTPEEIAAMREGRIPPKERVAAGAGSKSSFSKVFPWIVLAGIGGAAAYFLTQKNKTDKDEAAVDVLVDWD